MSLKIPLAHDFRCVWCYIALFQAERLKREFDIVIEWRGYELWPESLPWPEAVPAQEIPGRPPIPSRLDLMLAAENLTLPRVERPKRMRTHLAHLAAEFAKEHHKGDLFIPEVYYAYWERGEYINEVEFLCHLGQPMGLDPDAMLQSIESEQYADRIVGFDSPAYQTGIFNLPTFQIEGKKYAQPLYRTLEEAVAIATKVDR